MGTGIIRVDPQYPPFAMSPAAPPEIALTELPGHYIRRLHQISVGIFMQEAEPWGVTPVQYAALQTVRNQPGVDQRSLARLIALDTSTIGGVIDRLEARGLLQRNAAPGDRRVRQLTLTPAGQQLLADVIPAMRRVQDRLLETPPPPGRPGDLEIADPMAKQNHAPRRPRAGARAKAPRLDPAHPQGQAALRQRAEAMVNTNNALSRAPSGVVGER